METLKRINHILLFILAVIVLFFYGSAFFIPLFFGIFLAMLMTPFSNTLEKIRINRVLSSLISTLIAMLILGGIFYLLIYQVKLFAGDLPELKNELQTLINELKVKITSVTKISPIEQEKFLNNRSDSFLNMMEDNLTGIFSNITFTIFSFLLVFVYTFLFMLYRMKFTNFILMYMNKENKEKAGTIIHETGKVVFQYLWGRVQVMILLGIMYYITFLVFNIPYAILLAVFGAIVTIIPYIGPFIGAVPPILLFILNAEGIYEVFIFSIVIIVIHLVESYILEPFILGKEVEMNPLMVIIAILIGGIIWGIAGMILFVPIFAIIKIISNYIPELNPVGYLFGTSEKNSC